MAVLVDYLLTRIKKVGELYQVLNPRFWFIYLPYLEWVLVEAAAKLMVQGGN